MEDYQIVDLYWLRSENAIGETDRKYGMMLSRISYSLLSSHEDAEECLDDTYLAAWNRMPSDRPIYLGAFLSKIIRCISVNRYRDAHRQKRDGGIELLLNELAECIPGGETVEENYENGRLTDALNRFLHSLATEKRIIFIKRYFNSEPLVQIASELGVSEGKVKTVLFRAREELRKLLEKEELL